MAPSLRYTGLLAGTILVHLLLLSFSRSPKIATPEAAVPRACTSVVRTVCETTPTDEARVMALAPPPSPASVTLEEAWQALPEPRMMLGVDYKLAEMEKLLLSCKSFKEEFDAFAQHPKPDDYGFDNGMFSYVSAAMYYCLIRQRRPATVLEVGCGHSTYVARNAVRKNGVGKVVAIDPQPRHELEGANGISFIQKPVEKTPMEVFLSLKDGDIFFFDTWHTLNFANDVRYFFVDVLPRLAKGVLVHVHDVHMPVRGLTNDCFLTNRVFAQVAVQPVNRDSKWNEEFVLNTFLAYNYAFQVRWAGRFMWESHKDMLWDCLGRKDMVSSDATFFFERIV